jgi:hypothetical protein
MTGAFSGKNYAPFAPSPSIGRRGFAVPDAKWVDDIALNSLIQGHKFPIGAPENSKITARKQRHNSDENSGISATNTDTANGACGLGG